MRNLSKRIEQKFLINLQLRNINMSSNEGLGQWPMIPTKAFLYFPTKNQIREGKDQKQWRKIFQDGQPFDQYQNKKLEQLDKKLHQLRIVPHPWFDNYNRLRFLQANKFKIEDTCKSIKEGSVWRMSYFPLKSNAEADQKLNQGTIYYCGRDREYRPIMIVQITKMKKYSQQIVPIILNNLIEYALTDLLIPGQIQNYVLIIDLNDAGISDKSSVSKIVSFTSNTYRSRLFASYLLNTPFLIASGWNAFASAIVSENTLRKIKISKQSSHADMWTHIDKEIVEEKYGGTLPNQTGPYWPPSQKLMNYTSSSTQLTHVTKQQYNKLYKQGKLKNRKIKSSLIQKQTVEQTPRKGELSPILRMGQSKKQLNSVSRIQSQLNTNLKGDKKKLNPLDWLPPEKVKQEILPPIKKRDFKLFFEDEKFLQILDNK